MRTKLPRISSRYPQKIIHIESINIIALTIIKIQQINSMFVNNTEFIITRLSVKESTEVWHLRHNALHSRYYLDVYFRHQLLVQITFYFRIVIIISISKI